MVKAVIETWRGLRAWARWICLMPVLTLRGKLTNADFDRARQLLSDHCWRFLKTCRIEVIESGTPFPKGTGAVICYNEAAFPDVMTFGAMMWDHVDRIAAADLYAYFPFGRDYAERVQIEMVPRGDREGTDRLLGQVIEKVKAGDRLSWGGEGRVVGIDGVDHFKRGASLIAIRAQVPIVPVTFYGGHNIMPLGSIRARPGKVYVRFGTPISTEGLGIDDARDLSDRVQAIVADTYAQLKAEAQGA